MSANAGDRDSQSPSAPQRVSVNAALGSAVSAMTRSLWPWVGVVVVVWALGAFSIAACLLPGLVVVPALTWGHYKFLLAAESDRAGFDTVWRGFDDLGGVVPKVLGLAALQALVALPAGILMALSGELIGPRSLGGTTGGVVAMVAVLLLAVCIAVTFWMRLSWFFMVDLGLGPWASLRAATRLALPSWPQLLLLAIILQAARMAGFAALFVGVFPAEMLAQGTLAAVYRQLVPAAPQS